jgi:hypothetical protein
MVTTSRITLRLAMRLACEFQEPLHDDPRHSEFQKSARFLLQDWRPGMKAKFHVALRTPYAMIYTARLWGLQGPNHKPCEMAHGQK